MTTDLEPPVGLSTWERELFDHLVDHVRRESELIEAYERLAADAAGHIAYVLGLIVEDERRHHRLFEEWCNALRASAEFREVTPQVPYLTKTARPDDVLAAVRKFVTIERGDEKDIVRLKKLVRPERDVTVWNVLLDVMELDTQKHIALLRFLEHHPGR
jgi:rubrerythrin